MHSTRSRPPVRPTVRLRPVPPLDPPFDDECSPEVWFGRPGDLALADSPGRVVGACPDPDQRRTVNRHTPEGGSGIRAGASTDSSGPAARPAPHTRRLRAPAAVPVPRPTTAPSGGPAADGLGQTVAGAVVESFAGASAEARRAAKAFLDSCLEIVNGYRPAGHIRSRCNPADAGGVVERLASAATRISGRRRPGQPPRTVRLRRLRVCEPRPGVVEGAAAVGVAGRTWALAFRIEQRQGRWVGVSAEML
ncbi:Rv3235 family protein [Plantactinospora sonchi]|uniref:Rv3235 family protein n=1 Tax=Plantactinospora sonchi TaxID=1544735 RepID=A0ABU7RLA7_9ACTN